jgi:nucleoside-diphosphate-sugar epimerase
MSHNILLTGASGYLGGTILALLPSANLPKYSALYALVRTDSQASSVKEYGATPLTIDLSHESALKQSIITHKITIIYHLIDAWGSYTVPMIEALAQVKKDTGLDTHFLFTSGAKLFSSHVGAPTSSPLLDTDANLYSIQKSQKAKFEKLKPAVDANNTVIETAEALGVKSYIFVPCIVYGESRGFRNKISIQTVAIVKAAKKVRRVYAVDDGEPTWPVCHVDDTATLYLEILRGILEGRDVGSGKQGYYLASSGSLSWLDIYSRMAIRLEERGVVETKSVERAGDKEMVAMGEALAAPKELVQVHLGGLCTFTAEHGKRIGWVPKFAAEHLLEVANEEVDLILKNLEG